jgi:hypothetical protein
MNLIALFCVLVSVDFTEVEMPGLQVGPVQGASGEHTVNFRHADLDGDGRQDLLFASAAWLQRDETYAPENRIALPETGASAWIDVLGSHVYRWSREHLQVLELHEGQWRVVQDQELIRPGPAERGAHDSRRPYARGEDKLHRFVVPGTVATAPDLVALSPEGLHRFRLASESYQEAGTWDVLPEMRLAVSRTHAIWPADARRLVLPARQMDCRLALDGDRARVFSREQAPLRQARHHVRSITLDASGTVDTTAFTSPPVPRYVRPARLNADDTLDLAGTRWDLSSSATWPVPVCETWASLDGGKSFTVRRAPSLQRTRPGASFLDFDADGDQDLVTESTALFEAGTREALNQLLSRSAVDHIIRVYRQTASGFEDTPWITSRHVIDLERPPLRGGPRLDSYSAARLVDLTGDFNGDNRKDLVISKEPGMLSVYLLEGAAYPATPTTRKAYDASRTFVATDINADGRSDLVFRATAPDRPPVVWFTTGERP